MIWSLSPYPTFIPPCPQRVFFFLSFKIIHFDRSIKIFMLANFKYFCKWSHHLHDTLPLFQQMSALSKPRPHPTFGRWHGPKDAIVLLVTTKDLLVTQPELLYLITKKERSQMETALLFSAISEEFRIHYLNLRTEIFLYWHIPHFPLYNPKHINYKNNNLTHWQLPPQPKIKPKQNVYLFQPQKQPQIAISGTAHCVKKPIQCIF